MEPKAPREDSLDRVLAHLRALSDDQAGPSEADIEESLDPRLREALTLLAETAARLNRLEHTQAGPSDSARFLDSIVENIPYMIFVKDADELRFVRFNGAGERLLGYRREDLLGKNDFDFLPEKEARFFTTKDREVLRKGEVLDIPEEPIHTGSGERWLHTRKIPVLDDSGRPLFLLGISEDITEARAAATKLRETQRELSASEAHLRVLLAHLPGAMWTTDGALRFTSSAGARAEALGLADPALLGSSLVDHPLSVDADGAALRGALQGSAITGELRYGGRIYEVRIQSLGGEAGPGLIGLALDITDRQKLEAERLQSRIQRAQKLESLGLLAGGIAHDFNNLLGSLLGNASLALMKLPADAPARASIERVEASAERAADLTRQMLAYSGRGRFIIEPVDLRVVVEDIAELLRVSLSKDAQLVFRFPDELPAVEADVAQVRQLVMNLLTNASDALCGAPGIVTLSLALERADRNYLASTWLDEDLPEGMYVGLEVTDTGCGMDSETLAHMFDPFFTTKDTGHGLGLAATLGIVRGHKGAIRVYSEPGVGTSIKVLLPALDSPCPLVEPIDATDEGEEHHGTVLVVDDDEALRLLAKEILTEGGFDVILAKDGAEAVELFGVHKDIIVAVLLDMTMPRMNGEETFRELRRMQSDVRVLLSSGYNEQDATSRFAGKGLAGFLHKPYRAGVLIERMRGLVGTSGSGD
jgi:two-component system, cell cycle sensor histidine kinase and response regulator CckA